MAVHPSGHIQGSTEEVAHTLRLGVIVHAAAIATAPLLTFGTFVLTRAIGFEKPAATLAFVTYAFGAFAVMLAAAMSGLVAPKLIAAQIGAGAAEQTLIHGLARFEWYLNQAFAQLHVAFFSGAILLWSLGWPERGIAAAAVQIAGVVVAAGALTWLIMGTPTTSVHGMGAIVVAQGAWLILAALAMPTPDRPSRAGSAVP
jgi:hypothetical protein